MTVDNDKQKADVKEKSVASPKKLSLKKPSATAAAEEKPESPKATAKIALKKNVASQLAVAQTEGRSKVRNVDVMVKKKPVLKNMRRRQARL